MDEQTRIIASDPASIHGMDRKTVIRKGDVMSYFSLRDLLVGIVGQSIREHWYIWILVGAAIVGSGIYVIGGVS